MIKITYVIGNEVEGVYFDGKLNVQARTITACDIFKLVGCEFKVIEPDEGWLLNRTCLPQDLSDVIRGC